jgi:hypothetical protein
MKRTGLWLSCAPKYLVLTFCFAAILVNSCKKNTGPSNPVITLNSPLDTLIIHTGDTVLINGTISDNKSLHEVFITFRKEGNDTLLINDNPYTHGGKQYEFRYIWFPSQAGLYQLDVEAQDHDNHSVKKDFPFTVN